MRVVIQRVSQASVSINNMTTAQINEGMMILVGFEDEDNQEDIDWITRKITNLRIFDDENGVMNRSILDSQGEVLLVSQFTLHAHVKKGNRPSYIKAAKPNIAIPLYEAFKESLSQSLNSPIATGEFGADMQVGLINNGPVTICIDTKNKE